MKSWTAYEIALLVAVWIAATMALSGFLELSRRRPDIALLLMVAVFVAFWIRYRRYK